MSAIFLQTIERVTRELPGAFSVCAERLDTEGIRLAVNEERVFPAASVIKIAVALEVLCAIEEGNLDDSSPRSRTCSHWRRRAATTPPPTC